MSIFCRRIRSSSRSIGPSYTSPTVTENGDCDASAFSLSLSLTLRGSGGGAGTGCGSSANGSFASTASPSTGWSALNSASPFTRWSSYACPCASISFKISSGIAISPLLITHGLREPHSLLHFHQRLLRPLCSADTPVRQHVLDHARPLLQVPAMFLDRRNRAHDPIRHPALALDAADARRAAAVRRLHLRFFVRKHLMQIEHRANLGVPRIVPPHSRWVGDHRLQLRAQVGLRLGQADHVAIALRHLAPIQPGQLRRRRQQHIRLRQNLASPKARNLLGLRRCLVKLVRRKMLQRWITGQLPRLFLDCLKLPRRGVRRKKKLPRIKLIEPPRRGS